MDNLTKKQRSLCMSRIRSKHTKPEYIVRKALTKLGIRFKLHAKKLPGKPDIVIGSKKKIIFINGCFWHQHKGCKRRSTPKSNVAYWSKKLKRNVAKQKADIKALNKMEWKSIIIWECQTKNEKSLIKRLNKI